MTGVTVFIYLPNVKEHAPLSAGASVDHRVEVKTTGEHENRAADRGCCVSSCSASSILLWKVSHFLKLASLDCKDVALDLVSSKMIHDLNPVHQLIGDMEKNA